MAAVLRRKHSLRDASKARLVHRLRDGHGVNGPLARLSRDSRTEEMSEDNLRQAIRRLTGERPEDLFDMAGVEEDRQALQACLHFAILEANERGQALQDQERRGDPADQAQQEQVWA